MNQKTIYKILLLFCPCFSSVALFAQDKQGGKTFYILKSSLINILVEDTIPDGSWSMILEDIDTSYVTSIARIGYSKKDSTVLWKKKIHKSILSYKQFADYLKSSEEIIYIQKDKFFFLEPLDRKRYKAYHLFNMTYLTSQEDIFDPARLEKMD